MTLEAYLKKLRLSNLMTQKELAERLGVTHNTVCYYEKGKQKPCARVLKAYCETFGVNSDKLAKMKYGNQRERAQN